MDLKKVVTFLQIAGEVAVVIIRCHILCGSGGKKSDIKVMGNLVPSEFILLCTWQSSCPHRAFLCMYVLIIYSKVILISSFNSVNSLMTSSANAVIF